MASRSPAQVYQDLLAVGFNPAAAVTMTEIAGAESGYNDAAVGDVNLETSTWGPSFGLFQVRTVKSATGSGGDRDINALTGDDLAQARAAYTISNGGRNFGPWTTWTSGAYQQFADRVQQALGISATTPVDAQPFGTFGPSWLPWNWPSDAGNAAAAEVGSIRTVVIEVLFASLGVALVGLGVYGLAGKHLDRAAGAIAGAVT